MNRKICSILLLAIFCGMSAARASTDDPPRGQNPLRKLGRGLANVLFGFVEVPNQYTKAVSEHGGASGLTYGAPKGIVRWITREGVGLYEVITFPIPYPRGYRPIVRPEWPNEDYEP